MPEYFTIKELKERIKDLPDDMPVYIQRIEDHYFENNGWSTKEFVFEQWPGREPDMSDYILAWSGNKTWNKDKTEYAFVIEAHY